MNVKCRVHDEISNRKAKKKKEYHLGNFYFIHRTIYKRTFVFEFSSTYIDIVNLLIY